MNNTIIIMNGILKIVIVLCASGLIIRIIDWIGSDIHKKDKED